MKKNRLLFLPLLLCAMMANAEMQLKVVPLTGADEQYALAQIGKITFADDVMYLYGNSGEELGHTALAEIGRIVFADDNPSSALDETTGAKISIYPNPATESIVVNGLQGSQTVRVFDLQGRIVRSISTTSANISLPVGSLANGTYLLQVGAEVVKFIKQ